ncbi:MAG: sulfatase-like hydrolase/transferase [Chitinophagaceae bacterium]|nr:sulfatase-like hydrolase/transferase [Chitinophagaceae bacterium]
MQRGFDKYFGIIPGAANYFDPAGLKNGNDPVKPGKDFYLTDALSDTAASYIQQHKDSKKQNPFFMYVAYNAPHWPLHAKDKDIKKYADIYSIGWDKLREQRYRKQQKTGLLEASAKLNPRDAEVPAWVSIPESEKEMWAKRMAVYAAQVDCLDQGVGRIIQALKKNNLFDNTLIIFISDNGGCAENISREDKTITALGTGNSYESYRINWANASNTPFKMYKHWVHEGGISAPCVISWPNMIANKGTVVNTPAHLIDLMPTFINLAGATYPQTFNGHNISPLAGKSLLGIIKGEKNTPQRPIFWEHEANRAVRLGNWKLVSKGTKTKPYTGPWELYDIAADRSETNNLAKSQPGKVKELEAMWNKWATDNNVFPLNGKNNAERTQAAGKNAGDDN